MAENITTVLDRLDAANISLEDFLYLIQGTGPDRDRKMKLQQLRDFLQTAFTAFTLIGVGGRCEISSGAIRFIADNGKSVSLSYANGLNIERNGNDGGFSIIGTDVYINVSPAGIKVAPKTGNENVGVYLSWLNFLSVKDSNGDIIAGIDAQGNITGKTGAGFRNGSAEIQNYNVNNTTLTAVIANSPEMKYFIPVADGPTDLWSNNNFNLNAGVNDGYLYGEEIVVFNYRDKSLTVQCGTGNVTIAANHANKFILIKSIGAWVPLS